VASPNKKPMLSNNFKIQRLILILFTLLCAVLIFSRAPIPQEQSYHNFADQRNFFAIDNFLNVITNLPFVVIGVLGLLLFLRHKENYKDRSLANYSLLLASWELVLDLHGITIIPTTLHLCGTEFR
jgi:hypothetical protein